MKACRQQAEDLLLMWKSVDEQKTLWQLDMGVEKQLSGEELARRSAHRVGLHIPQALDATAN